MRLHLRVALGKGQVVDYFRHLIARRKYKGSGNKAAVQAAQSPDPKPVQIVWVLVQALYTWSQATLVTALTVRDKSQAKQARRWQRQQEKKHKRLP